MFILCSHGVGCYLNVHEGPSKLQSNRVSQTLRFFCTVLLDTVVLTNSSRFLIVDVFCQAVAISSSIRSASVANTALAPGMCLSNEPGYYEPGAFGIRIESIVTVTPRKLKYNYPKDKQYLGFETIQLKCEVRLIVIGIMKQLFE